MVFSENIKMLFKKAYLFFCFLLFAFENYSFCDNPKNNVELITLYEHLAQNHPKNIDYLFTLDKFYDSENQSKEAINFYTQALNLDHDRQDILIKLAYRYLEDQSLDLSSQTFQTILKINPKNIDAFIGLGLIEVQNKDFTKAEKFFSQALKIDSTNIKVLLNLADVETEQNEFEQASATLNQVLQLDPSSEKAKKAINYLKEKVTLAEAKKLIIQKNYQGAANLYQQLLLNDPKNINYLFALGKLYDGQNESIKAINFYNQALDLEPEREDILIKLAYRYLEDRSLTLSSQTFQTILKINPKSVDAFVGLGLIEVQNKHLVNAEKYFLEALKIDAANIPALLNLADLKTEQNELGEAHTILTHILQLDPLNEKAKKAFHYLKAKVTLAEAKKLITQKNYQGAAKLYQHLVKDNPKNSDYLFALGNLYTTLNLKQEAIQLYEKALFFEPNRQDVKHKLAYIYLDQENYNVSAILFSELLADKFDDVEALIGLGLIEIKFKHLDEAEKYFFTVLIYDPKNIKALSNLAEIQIEKNEDSEAYRLFKAILAIEPHNKSAEKGLDELEKRAFLSDAKLFIKQGNVREAIEIYKLVIDRYPEDIDTYLLLGKSYLRLECYNNAIAIYTLALEKKPCNSEIRNALAFAYLRRGSHSPLLWDHYQWFIYYPYLFYFIKEDIYPRVNWDDLAISQDLFDETLSKDPINADALVGRGRIEALKDHKEKAHELYSKALSQQPDNTTALAYSAALDASTGRYFTARKTYLELLELEPEDKTIQQDYINVVNNSDPIYSLTGYYSEENEQDFITLSKKDWVARLINFGEVFSWAFAIKDRSKLFGGVVNESFILKNLLNDTKIYSLNVQRATVGFSWNYNPYTSILCGGGFSSYSQRQKSTFFTKKGFYFQAFLSITYNKNHNKILLETVSDAPIVARSFSNNRSALIDRQFLRGLYEYDFGNRTLFGLTAANIWYINPIKRNQQQLVSTWFQVGPPKFWQNLVFRYQFIYGRFNKVTSDYYTYRFQTTHWINVSVSKNWWDNKLITEAGYGHAWQRGFEQGQIIVVTPVAPFHLIHREINATYARLQYDPNDFIKLTIAGTYTLDSFNYTTAAITGKFSWRF